jgi:nitroreductase
LLRGIWEKVQRVHPEVPESGPDSSGKMVDAFAPALSAILNRTTAIKLTEPGPTSDDLKAILSAGARAPDHGKLRPWRFIVIGKEAQMQFGELLGRALLGREPSANNAALEREKAKAARGPTLIIVAAAVQWEHPKIPAIEQILAVGAAVENMLLAAQVLGYGAMWKTGEPAYDAIVKEGLGLHQKDQIVSLLYLGTAQVTAAARSPSLEAVVRFL